MATKLYPSTNIEIGVWDDTTKLLKDNIKASFVGVGGKVMEGVDDKWYECYSVSQVDRLFGKDSMNSIFARKWFMNSGNQKIWMGTAKEPTANSPTSLTATITVTTKATENGTTNLYIGSKIFPITVTTDNDVSAIATSIVTELNKDKENPFTASSSSGVVTLTMNKKGKFIDKIPIKENYKGELPPKGLALTIVEKASDGTGEYDLTNILDAMGDRRNDNFIMCDFQSSKALAKLKSIGDTRFSDEIMSNFFVDTAMRGTSSEITTELKPKNEKLFGVLALGESHNYNIEYLACFTGQAMLSAGNDPAKSLEGIELKGVSPFETDFTRAEGEMILDAGGTVLKNTPNSVKIVRAVTLYKLDTNGNPDYRWKDRITIFSVSYHRNDLRYFCDSKFRGRKLGQPGRVYLPSAGVVEVQDMRADIIERINVWNENGLVDFPDDIDSAIDISQDGDIVKFELRLSRQSQLRFIIGKIRYSN